MERHKCACWNEEAKWLADKSGYCSGKQLKGEKWNVLKRIIRILEKNIIKWWKEIDQDQDQEMTHQRFKTMEKIVSHIEEKWDQVHSKELITLNNVVVRLGAKTDVITSLTF